jgi:hypothetical protein
VNDIAIGIVGIFSAGHNDKEFVACINDLDVVNCKLTVEGDRNDCLHRAILKKFSYFNIRDLHDVASVDFIFLLDLYNTVSAFMSQLYISYVTAIKKNTDFFVKSFPK